MNDTHPTLAKGTRIKRNISASDLLQKNTHIQYSHKIHAPYAFFKISKTDEQNWIGLWSSENRYTYVYFEYKSISDQFNGIRMFYRIFNLRI